MNGSTFVHASIVFIALSLIWAQTSPLASLLLVELEFRIRLVRTWPVTWGLPFIRKKKIGTFSAAFMAET